MTSLHATRSGNRGSIIVRDRDYLLLHSLFVGPMSHPAAYYEGDSKRKGKIHLTAVIQVTVSNFTYYFST